MQVPSSSSPAAATTSRSLPPGGRAAWIAWGLAAACYLLALFHRMSLGVAALDAEHRLGVGAGAVAALSVLQLTMYLLMQVPAGLLADRFGSRRTLALGMATMAAGEMLFALAGTMPVSLLGRALIGAGDACIFLNVLRVAAHWFPRRRFSLLTAITAGVGAVGQLATTLPLTLSLHQLGWTTTFASGAALTVVVAIVCLGALRERPAGAPAPRDHEHPPILAGLRSAWAHPATRQGFWTHFSLMAPFVVLTGLWGHPFLVDVAGMGDSAASAILLVSVAASAITAPLVGLAAARRPSGRARVAARVCAAVTLAVAVLMLWPGHAPVVVLALCFMAVGAGGATSMLGFDLARREGDAHNGGSVSALVNLGGFSAAIAADAALGGVQSVAGQGHFVLLPLLALQAAGLVQTTRRAQRTSGRIVASTRASVTRRRRSRTSDEPVTSAAVQVADRYV
jgi:MFS family permease